MSKYLTNVLKPLTDEFRHKLQSSENFIDAIKTIQIPDDHKLVSCDVKSLFTSIPIQLALDCTENAIENSTVELPPTYRRHYGPTQPLFDFDVLLVQRQTLQTVTRLCYGLSSFCCCSRNSRAKHREQALATPYAKSLTNSRGSRVQSRGRGSNVAAGENDLGFEVTAE